jgi:hypothetical protein
MELQTQHRSYSRIWVWANEGMEKAAHRYAIRYKDTTNPAAEATTGVGMTQEDLIRRGVRDLVQAAAGSARRVRVAAISAPVRITPQEI